MHFYLISEPNTTCVNIDFYTRSPEYNWSFGHCMSPHTWLGAGTYTEKCCDFDSISILTCNTTSKEGDWSNNVLMMFGHRFCDDLVGQKGIITVNVSGMCKAILPNDFRQLRSIKAMIIVNKMPNSCRATIIITIH